MEQATAVPSRFQRLAALCLTAIASLDCPLERREKRVLNVLIQFSFDLDREQALIGSNDQLRVLAELDKGDASNALKRLEDRRVIQVSNGPPIHKLRRPQIYAVMPDVLLALVKPRARSPQFRALQAQVGHWLLQANRDFPLQPDLFPPDLDLLGPVLAELSRAAVLDAADQNEGPKSGAFARPGEVSASEMRMREPGRSPLYQRQDEHQDEHQDEQGQKPVTHRDDPKIARDPMIAEACRRSIMGGAPVGEAPTGKASWRISKLENLQVGASRARASDAPDVPDVPDGVNINPSGNIRMEPAPVGESPTRIAEQHEPEAWRPPSQAQVLFRQLEEAMGPRVIGNYGTQWRNWCRQHPREVYETLESYRNAKQSARFKGWGGGRWRDEFNRRRAANGRQGTEVGKTP